MTDTATITWRDENYGSDPRRHAFRIYDAFSLPKAQRALLNATIKASGFEVDGRRRCWASDDADAPARMLAALTAAGFMVDQRGYTHHDAMT